MATRFSNKLIRELSPLVFETKQQEFEQAIKNIEYDMATMLGTIDDQIVAVEIADALDLPLHTVKVEFNDCTGYHRWKPKKFLNLVDAEEIFEDGFKAFTDRKHPVHESAINWRFTLVNAYNEKDTMVRVGGQPWTD